MLKYGYEKVLFPFYCSDPPLYLALQSDFQTGRGLFKIATYRRGMVLASSPQLIEDVGKAPEDVMAFTLPRSEARTLPRTYLHINCSVPSV
jgi:hypothetical protein